MASQQIPYSIPTQGGRCEPTAIPRTCSEPDNLATQCLKGEAWTWAQIALNPLFALLKVPARYRLASESPFNTMPQDGIRLNAIPTSPLLLSSFIANRFTPIVSYTVPPGFDGVINSVFTKFVPQNGPGLQDGSGMITWLVQINNYLAVGYESLTLQFGNNSSIGPTAHGGGIRIKANDQVTVYAIVTVAGLGFLDPNGIVLAALQGWTYANR